MKLANTVVCLIGLALSSPSCVKEVISDCPVLVAVRDKNYDNAGEAGTPLIDENLPILSYINSLVLRNRTGDSYTVYDETLSSGERVHRVDRTHLIPGIDQLTLTAGHSVEARQYFAGQTSVTLHPNGLEGDDIYTGYDDITVPVTLEQTIWLYRTKGMLIVEPVNMPADVRTVGISISGLYSTADSGTDGLPVYSGSASVSKLFDTASTGTGARFSTILAPSVGDALSPLTIVFTLADGTRESVSLEVAIKRNHITLVRPEYNVLTKTWTIEVMVDGNWVKIENLNITD